MPQDERAKAKESLHHYLRVLGEQKGLQFGPDNRVDIDAIIDNTIQAAVDAMVHFRCPIRHAGCPLTPRQDRQHSDNHSDESTG